MDHDLPEFRFANSVHSDVTMTSVFFNNCRLTAVRLVQFKGKHFELIARCLNQPKNKKCFGNNRKELFYYTSSHSVSLLTLALIFQTAITGG